MGYDTVQWAKPLEGIRIILIVKVVGSVCGGVERRRGEEEGSTGE